MTADHREIAVRFMLWWSDPQERVKEAEEGLLHPDLEYEQTYGFEGEGALWLIRQSLPWADLKAEIEELPPNEVRIIGTGTDPVTLLRHRLEWKLRIQDGVVRSVVETIAPVDGS